VGLQGETEKEGEEVMGLLAGNILVGSIILGLCICSGLEKIAFRLHEVAKAIEEKNKGEKKKEERGNA
jgi:hypothetical protein